MNKQVLVIEDKTSFDRMVSKAGSRRTRTSSNALPAAGGAADLAAGGDVGAGQALFAQKCTACHGSRRSIRSSSARDSKACCTIPSHPNLVNGEPATPAERRQDPAERLHRQHGHDAERNHERPLGARYRESRRLLELA